MNFRWTGSNTNPNNNDGQGRQGTDRSNVVLQRAQAYAEGTGAAYEPGAKFGHWGRSYPEWVKNSTFLGMSQEDLMSLALLTPSKSTYIYSLKYTYHIHRNKRPGRLQNYSDWSNSVSS